jgi:hypothetical protein
MAFPQFPTALLGPYPLRVLSACFARAGSTQAFAASLIVEDLTRQGRAAKAGHPARKLFDEFDDLHLSANGITVSGGEPDAAGVSCWRISSGVLKEPAALPEP